MARAKSNQPANDAPQETTGPVIQYFGEGAENVEFTIPEGASLIRVFSHGMVLVDY